MKIAMLLVWVLFLATAVEALPGGGGRQLAGKGKGILWQCKTKEGVARLKKALKVEACWNKCQRWFRTTLHRTGPCMQSCIRA